MPVGVVGISWDFVVHGLRIQRARGADLIFNLADIPNNIQNQGAQAIDNWLNTGQNLAKQVWGVSAPPPYMVAKVRTMSPFYFDFLLSDARPSWFDTLGEIYPFP